MIPVQPKIRGFICTTAHPIGCQAVVKEQIAYVKNHKKDISQGPKRVLIIGASTGYGLSSRIVAAFGFSAQTLGVSFERPANEKRTASPGWYNTAFFEQEANANSLYAKSIIGDAFTQEIKQKVIDTIKQDWNGEVDLIIYSLASPRRQDPKTGEIYHSVLKPIGHPYKNKTVDAFSGTVSTIHLEPANELEIDHTIKVMGGEDWSLWINALIQHNVLAKGCKTVAYSYIGPELTYPIYREGTIGKAKEDLEKTAHILNQQLAKHCQGQAFISVNKALATQASAAIPVVPLYISLLYKIMKEQGTHEGTIQQITRLFYDHLYKGNKVLVDDMGRIRLDDLEFDAEVQRKVEDAWKNVTTENLLTISDIEGYRHEFYRLFGFDMPHIRYENPVELEIDIPSVGHIEV